MNKVDRITLQDLKEGSDAVLKEVYEANRTKFILFAKRYNLSDDDIVDVYQDTFIVFHNNIMSGKLNTLTSSISTYLFGIGKNLLINKMKASKRSFNPDFDISLLQEDENLLTNIDIDNEETTEEQQLFYKYFESLGKQCKELLNLFYYRGYTIDDIVEHTDYNTSNVVKSAKSRCLKTLKERIKSHKN